jgi:hypothetical protein
MKATLDDLADPQEIAVRVDDAWPTRGSARIQVRCFRVQTPSPTASAATP